MFGSTLAAICQHDQAQVPRFLIEVTRLIEERGLDVDGLYRVSGNQSAVQRIRCQVDQGTEFSRLLRNRLDRYDTLRNEEDVHVLTGAVKLFFRELSDPLFPVHLNKEFMAAISKLLINGAKERGIPENFYCLE